MSRVSVLEQLYCKRKSALEFNYDELWAPPIKSLLCQSDIDELYRIATSLKYNGNIDLKYKLIDNVMNPRGFRKAHAGTNRVVYNFLEDPRFVAKIAIDRVGIKDTPAEYKNQEYFKPFCCKIFEVDPTGVIGFVERVNPISSLEEFMSVSDDIFNLILTKIVGKYVLDDIGVTKYMNYGLRCNANGYTFGPVILDFPYAYELDGNKLVCNKTINTPFGPAPCGGEIDYDAGFDHLVCTKCGRTYQARDLSNHNENIKLVLNDKGGFKNIMARARIISGDGKVISDSGASTKTYVTKEQFKSFNNSLNMDGDIVVTKTINKRSKSRDQKKQELFSSLMIDVFADDKKDEHLTTSLGSIMNQEDTKELKVTKEISNKDLINQIAEQQEEVVEEEAKEETKKPAKKSTTKKTTTTKSTSTKKTTTKKKVEEPVKEEAPVDEEVVVEEKPLDENVENAIDTLLDNSLKAISDEEEVNSETAVEENSGEDTEETNQDEYDDYEEMDYSEYIKNNKAQRRTKKANSNRKNRFDDDMDEY